MSRLSASQRKHIPTKDFAVPSKARTPGQKAKSGGYPIEDIGHARNALARSSGKPVAGQVRAAVVRKYPSLAKKGKGR
jgi:hypothetical protein